VNYDLSLYLFFCELQPLSLPLDEEVKREVLIHRRRGKERGCNSQKRR
jgi:hypothetical protein